MLSVGDKVKFLNTSGGGIVAKIIDSRMVSVMVEDGFEIPTLSSELVRIEPGNPAGRFFEEKVSIGITGNLNPREEPGDDRMQRLPRHLAGNRSSEDIYLAFVPHDQKWIITGQVDIFLINNTSYDVLYNVFTMTPLGHFEGVDYGSIFPDSKVLVCTINREQLGHWTHGAIQFLFHREQEREVVPPFNSEFMVEGKKFFKEGNYRENHIIQARGIVIKVVSLGGPEREEKKDEPAAETNRQSGKTETLLAKYRVAPREAVVDLHIHELVDDPSNLDKSDILDFQKNFFLKCLDDAMAGHYLKVVFIHGVGNGVLRSVIVDLLKKHEGIEWIDAPMAKYGVGALEVRIPHNG